MAYVGARVIYGLGKEVTRAGVGGVPPGRAPWQRRDRARCGGPSIICSRALLRSSWCGRSLPALWTPTVTVSSRNG
jgi:hypothetical protein